MGAFHYMEFNDPVITKDAKTKSMFAWMNREALEQTIVTQRMAY